VGSSTIASLLQELLKTQSRIKALETHVAEQLHHQELMQRAYQDLEAEHLTIRNSMVEHNPEQVRKLERQVGEMQEQILMQEKQAEEYETAIHHWKDRYTTSQQKACQLKELLTQHLPKLPSDLIPTELLALLETIQPTTVEELSQPVSPTLKSGKLKRKPKVDLPEFLTRQRSGSQPKP
jgi:chromosome segregation ATPase